MRALFSLICFLPLCVQAGGILYLGDSQSYGNFGTYFAQVLEREMDVNLYAVSGSSPRHWGDATFHSVRGGWLCKRKWKQYKTGQTIVRAKDRVFCPKAKSAKHSVVKELVLQHNPDKVVFQFLGNSLFLIKEAQRRGGEAGERYLQKYLTLWFGDMLDPIGDRPCVFLTSNPNHESKITRNRNRRLLEAKIVEFVKKNYSNCHTIKGMSDEAYELIARSKKNFWGDLVHLNERGAKLFRDYVESKL